MHDSTYPWIEYENDDTWIRCSRCGRKVIMPNLAWKKDNKVFAQFLAKHGKCKGLERFF